MVISTGWFLNSRLCNVQFQGRLIQFYRPDDGNYAVSFSDAGRYSNTGGGHSRAV